MINKKKDHEFERKHVRVYRRFWREEGEGRNYVIIISKKKQKRNKKIR